MIAWLLVAAMAQEPVVEDAPTVPEPEAVLEVVVWGEAAIRDARYDVVRAFEAAGWTKVREPDGAIRFRGPAPWMGKATLTYDGDLSFRRPVLAMRVKPLDEPREPPPEQLSGIPTDRDASQGGGTSAIQGHDAGSFWLLPSWNVVGPAHERARQAIEAELTTYRAVLEETRKRAE